MKLVGYLTVFLSPQAKNLAVGGRRLTETPPPQTLRPPGLSEESESDAIPLKESDRETCLRIGTDSGRD